MELDDTGNMDEELPITTVSGNDGTLVVASRRAQQLQENAQQAADLEDKVRNSLALVGSSNLTSQARDALINAIQEMDTLNLGYKAALELGMQAVNSEVSSGVALERLQLTCGTSECGGELAAFQQQVNQQKATLSILGQQNQTLSSNSTLTTQLLAQQEQQIQAFVDERIRLNQSINEKEAQLDEALKLIQENNKSDQLALVNDQVRQKEEQIESLNDLVQQKELAVQESNTKIRDLIIEADRQLKLKDSETSTQLSTIVENANKALAQKQREAEEQQKQLQDQVNSITTQALAIREASLKIERERDSVKEEARKKEQQLAIVGKTEEKLNEVLAQVREQASTLEIQLKSQVSDVNAELERVRELYESQATINQQLQNQLENVKSECAQIEFSSVEQRDQELTQRNQRIQELESDLITTKSALETAERSQLVLKKAVSTNEQQLALTQKSNEEILREKEAVEKQFRDAQIRMTELASNEKVALIDVAQNKDDRQRALKDNELLQKEKDALAQRLKVKEDERLKAQQEALTLKSDASTLQGKLEALQKQNTTLTGTNISQASLNQQILALQSQIALYENREKQLVREVEAAQNLAKQATQKTLQLGNLESKENQLLMTAQQSTTTLTTSRDLLQKKLNDLEKALASKNLYRLDVSSGIVTPLGPNSFDATSLLQKDLLILGETQKTYLERAGPLLNKLNVLQFYDPAEKPGSQYKTFLQADKDWNKAKYLILRENDFFKLREACNLPSGGGPINTTSTTTTTPFFGGPSTSTLTERPPVMGLGAAVNLATHATMLNQVDWQIRGQSASENSGQYIVDLQFSRSTDPALDTMPQLQFRAWNVHLLDAPNTISEDPHYLVDLVKPVPVSEITYFSFGTLIKNSIYGHGSLAMRVIDKKTQLPIREEVVSQYSFDVAADLPYNTSLVLRPSRNITFFARYTGNDTFILDTIVIRKA